MRLLGKSLLIISLILLGKFGYDQQWYVELWSGFNKNPTLLEHARPSPAYLLTQDNWLRFAINNRGNSFTVISNASIARADSQSPGDAWKYAIEYQVLNAAGTPIKQSIYHHRAGLRLFYDDTKNESLTRAFFLDDSLVPTNSSILRINTEGLESPATLQLKLANYEPALNEVMVRIYQPDPVPDHKLSSAWQRLSEKQKMFLSRGNVYGPELLREQEKQFLLRNRSVPVGPQGIRGEDYQDRIIYFLREYTDDLVVQEEQPVLPAGLLVDNWLRGIIVIPEQGARLALAFTPLDDNVTSTTSHLYLNWVGHGTKAPKQQHIAFNNQTTIPAQDFDGGTLEIQSTTAGVIRAYTVTGNAVKELDVTPVYLRSYVVTTQFPVEYLIDHTQNQATPFRVDIRAFSNPAEQRSQPRAESVQYVVTDKQENIIKQGQLAIDSSVSNYDRVSTDHKNWRLSDPSRYYFRLPKNANKIRFLSEHPALLSGYSRPPNLIRKLKVPEDYYATADNQQARQPAWFRLRALENTTLTSNNRTMLLRVQHRPRETNNQIMAGEYLWESYEPNGSWLARYLLTPRNTDMAARKAALDVTYRPVPTATPEPVAFQPPPNRERVTPSLIYLRGNRADQQGATHKSTGIRGATSEPIEILLDGKAIYRGKMANSRGTIMLPEISAGKHHITINASSSTQFFLNYTDANYPDENYLSKNHLHKNNADTDNPQFLKRLAHRLQARGLSFVYDKTADEDVVSTLLYLPYNLQQRTNISVNIEPISHRSIGPFRNWSFLQRSYDIRPDNEQRIAVLNTRDEFVGNKRRLFITLGSDLPAGRYRIHVKPEQNINAYFLLYRLTPGQFKQRVFFSESRLSDHYATE